MHTVTNISKTSQPVMVRQADGNLRQVRLEPGESRALDVDPNQARFQSGALTAEPVAAEKPKAAKPAVEPVAEPAPDTPNVADPGASPA